MSAASDVYQVAMEGVVELLFHEELVDVWGAVFGAYDEVGLLRRAMVRMFGVEFEVISEDVWDVDFGAFVDLGGRWYWTDRHAPDLDLVVA